MHEVGVAFCGDQVLGGLALASRVEGWATARRGRRDGTAGEVPCRSRLGGKHVIFHLVKDAPVREVLLPPAAIKHIQPLRCAGVPLLVFIKGNAVFCGLVLPPA